MKDLEKGKASITGFYSRMDKKVNDDFARKCKDSDIKGVDGQSQREVILEMLVKHYNYKGDNLFNILDTTPF